MPRTFTIRHDPGNIGRNAVIVYAGKLYVANVIDQIAGSRKPKRVRIHHDPTLQGKVLMPGQYEFKQWTDDD